MKSGGAFPSGAPKKVDPKKPGDELDIQDIFKPITQAQKIEKGLIYKKNTYNVF